MTAFRSVGVAVTLFAVAVAAGSCEEGSVTRVPDGGVMFDANGTDGTQGTFAKGALLEAAATCALDRYKIFEVAMTALETKTDAHRTMPNELTLAEARSAWRLAMGQWQQAELFSFGPAAPTFAPGGQGLGSQIYAFPSTRCQVDIQLVSQTYKRADFASSLVGGRGLGALEYLLFNTATTNTCMASLEINSKGTWAALTADELARRRADYADVVAKDVLLRSRTLVAAWEGGGFRQQLVTAGAGSKVFNSAQEALNSISNAIFYLDSEVKDDKLGKPVGLHMSCSAAACPASLESAYARESTVNVVNNLLGAQRLLVGCGADGTGLGFDDWLVGVGRTDLADALRASLTKALTLASDPELTLEDAITNMPDKVRALHAAVKELASFLETNVKGSLNLALPMSVETDND